MAKTHVSIVVYSERVYYYKLSIDNFFNCTSIKQLDGKWPLAV